MGQICKEWNLRTKGSLQGLDIEVLLKNHGHQLCACMDLGKGSPHTPPITHTHIQGTVSVQQVLSI